MHDDKTESQMRAAGILLALEMALADLYPGQVSGTGTLWNRKITVWLNDLEDMVIDFSSTEGIRARIIRSEKSSGSGSGDSKRPEGDLHLALNADMETIYDFIRDLIVDTAYVVNINPNQLVRKIADVAADTSRMKQAFANLDGTPVPNLFKPS